MWGGNCVAQASQVCWGWRSESDCIENGQSTNNNEDGSKKGGGETGEVREFSQNLVKRSLKVVRGGQSRND